MLLEGRKQGTYRNIGYVWADENIGKDWTQNEFRVGVDTRRKSIIITRVVPSVPPSVASMRFVQVLSLYY